MVIIFSLSSEFPINPLSTYFLKVACTLFTDLIWSLILFSSSTHPQYGPLITGVHSRFSSALSGSAIRVNVWTLDPPPYAIFVYVRNRFMENPYSHYFNILPCVTESSWQIIILLLFPRLSLKYLIRQLAACIVSCPQTVSYQIQSNGMALSQELPRSSRAPVLHLTTY